MSLAMPAEATFTVASGCAAAGARAAAASDADPIRNARRPIRAMIRA